MPDGYSVTASYPLASTPVACQQCGGLVPAGQPHEEAAYATPGGSSTLRTCLPCAALTRALWAGFLDVMPWVSGPQPGELVNDLLQAGLIYRDGAGQLYVNEGLEQAGRTLTVSAENLPRLRHPGVFPPAALVAG